MLLTLCLAVGGTAFNLNSAAGEVGGGVVRNPGKPHPIGTTKPSGDTKNGAGKSKSLVNNENISESRARRSEPGTLPTGAAAQTENAPQAAVSVPQASDTGSSSQKKEKRYVTVQDSNGNWTMQDTHHPGDDRYTHTYRTEEDAKDATKANNKHWNKINKGVMLDLETGQADLH
jgi:hypothetical protein